MTDETDEPWFEIERQLRDDIEGRERDRLLTRLEEAARSVKRQLDLGVTPAEFPRLDAIRQGLNAGQEVVTQVWRAHHPTP